MKNAVIFTLVVVVGFMMFALLYQPERIESQENIGLNAPIIYFSPHNSRDTFLVDQGTGMVYQLAVATDAKGQLFWLAMTRNYPKE